MSKRKKGKQKQAGLEPPRKGSAAHLWIALLLAVLTISVYAGVGGHEFINLDDGEYIESNPHVHGGVTMSGLGWALTAMEHSNWYPLTWISYMIDCQLFGLDAGKHHLMSLAFHVANTLLLFFILLRMTGAQWACALVSALFALHPLHVESVAWIAERKDVLSTLFWLLTMLAYLRYIEKTTWARYGLVCLLFALGLMAKAMVVTLPLALLLLDYWPLRRTPFGRKGGREGDPLRPNASGQESGRQGDPLPRPASGQEGGAQVVPFRTLVVEKLPLLALSAGCSILMYLAQREAGAVVNLETLSLMERVINALNAYPLYLWKTLAPVDLAIFYPLPETYPLWQTGLSFVVLVGISGFALRRAADMPYLIVGWLWYLGTLVPVIGLVRVGAQALADRYTYVPHIGIFVMVAWGARDLVKQWPRARQWAVGAACLCLAAFAGLTHVQVGYWRNSITIFEHAATVVKDNALAHSQLGLALMKQSRYEEAESQFRKALAIRPEYADALSHLGSVLLFRNDLEGAREALDKALLLKPGDLDILNNAGMVLMRQGEFAQATEHFRKLLDRAPGSASGWANLAVCFDQQGKPEEAAKHFRRALALEPSHGTVHYGLGLVLVQLGKDEEAAQHFKDALRYRPDLKDAQKELEKLQHSQP